MADMGQDQSARTTGFESTALKHISSCPENQALGQRAVLGCPGQSCPGHVLKGQVG